MNLPSRISPAVITQLLNSTKSYLELASGTSEEIETPNVTRGILLKAPFFSTENQFYFIPDKDPVTPNQGTIKKCYRVNINPQTGTGYIDPEAFDIVEELPKDDASFEAIKTKYQKQEKYIQAPPPIQTDKHNYIFKKYFPENLHDFCYKKRDPNTNLSEELRYRDTPLYALTCRERIQLVDQLINNLHAIHKDPFLNRFFHPSSRIFGFEYITKHSSEC